jgi:3-hydroxybutyryl-CoA dehydrogenase
LAIQTVAVVGTGVMGQGIAQACAAAGYIVQIFDAEPACTANAIDKIGSSLSTAVSKGKMTDETRKEILSRISSVAGIGDVRGDLIIEAIVEQLQPKKDIFSELEKGNGNSILATNTSTFPVSDIAAGLQKPGNCIGLHFFNPAPVMKLVEVIAGRNSLPDAVSMGVDFVKRLQKIPVLVNDSPGFIVNRIARGYYLESLKVIEEGGCSKEVIDSLMRNSGFRMGPFELMDLIGIDTNLAVTKSLYDAFGRPERFKPSPIQEAMVRDGKLGVKSSKGFYDYPR